MALLWHWYISSLPDPNLSSTVLHKPQSNGSAEQEGIRFHREGWWFWAFATVYICVLHASIYIQFFINHKESNEFTFLIWNYVQSHQFLKRMQYNCIPWYIDRNTIFVAACMHDCTYHVMWCRKLLGNSMKHIMDHGINCWSHDMAI